MMSCELKMNLSFFLSRNANPWSLRDTHTRDKGIHLDSLTDMDMFPNWLDIHVNKKLSSLDQLVSSLKNN